MADFGRAAHTVSDEASPAHQDGNGFPMIWRDPYLHPIDTAEHVAAERQITPQQLARAIASVQAAFGLTFGQVALRNAKTKGVCKEQMPCPADTIKSPGGKLPAQSGGGK